MRRARHASVVVTFVLALALSAAALGHGPCDCTRRDSAVQVEPGDRLTIAAPVIEVIWNPRPEELRIDPSPLIADDYVAGTPTVTVLARRAKRYHLPGFRVPDVPDGRYLVAIYDGSEGGDHYTWDYVVVRRSQPAAMGRTSGSSRAWIWVLLGALGATAGVLSVGGWRQMRSQVDR
jgi:hypothetical protein